VKTLVLIISLSACLSSEAQEDAATYIRRGNELYTQKQYDRAIEEYDRALQLDPGNSTARFNMANALYRLGKRPEAMRVYSDAEANSRDRNFRSATAYNRGVLYTNQKKVDESIEEYKQALRLNPEDQQARENLQKALLEKKKQQNQGPKQQQQQSRSSMSQRQAEQQLKQLEQKEKQVQEKVQKSKNQSTGGTGKDW